MWGTSQSRTSISLALVAALLAGCPVDSKTAPIPRKSTAGPVAVSKPTEVRGPIRAIPQTGVAQQLTGKAKLLSDHGGSIISNNTGNLLSDGGGALISNNGGNLTSKTRYLLADLEHESPLAEAIVEVLDAGGQLLVGDGGKPLASVTDQNGRFSLSAVLPDETLILRIRLFPNAKPPGGNLLALLPRAKDARGPREFSLDTASSLGASYVLEKYVKQRQAVLDLLPDEEARNLQRVMEDARRLLPAVPTYQTSALVAAAEALRGQAPAVDKQLKAIEALLLVGQKNLGQGLLATKVPLVSPVSVVGDAGGNLYIAEGFAGRIRRIASDGTASTYAGGDTTGSDGEDVPALKAAFDVITDLALAPDGQLYVSCYGRSRVRRIAPDGLTRTVAGNGTRDQGAVDVLGTATSLHGPGALALTPDGRLRIAENITLLTLTARLLALGTDGILRAEAGPKYQNFTGVSVAPDGTVYTVGDGKVDRQRPGGVPETIYQEAEELQGARRVLVAPDGSIYVLLELSNRVIKLAADGSRTAIAGTGLAGSSGDGGPATAAQLNQPFGLWLSPTGELFIADTGNGLIRKIGKDGIITTVAGTRGFTQVGDVQGLAVNSPTAIVLDSKGRIVVTETAGNLLKRLEDQTLVTIAGSEVGFSGDGGPATKARFNAPCSLAYHGDDLYVVDGANDRIRKIDANGVITTVVGSGDSGPSKSGVNGLDVLMGRVTGLAFDRDGLLYWADNEFNQILRVNRDGKVELIAGSPGGGDGEAGDDGPAINALLSRPLAIAFDSQGDLYVADLGNLRVRKIALTQPGYPIGTVVGLRKDKALAKLVASAHGGANIADDEGGLATEALLVGPCTLGIDAEDVLYVGEAGTGGLAGLSSIASTERQGTRSSLLGPIPIEALPKIGSRIRKVDLRSPERRITTVVGPGSKVLPDSGGENALRLPLGLVFDRDGRLVIADTGNNQILLIPRSAL